MNGIKFINFILNFAVKNKFGFIVIFLITIFVLRGIYFVIENNVFYKNLNFIKYLIFFIINFLLVFFWLFIYFNIFNFLVKNWYLIENSYLHCFFVWFWEEFIKIIIPLIISIIFYFIIWPFLWLKN